MTTKLKKNSYYVVCMLLLTKNADSPVSNIAEFDLQHVNVGGAACRLDFRHNDVMQTRALPVPAPNP